MSDYLSVQDLKTMADVCPLNCEIRGSTLNVYHHQRGMLAKIRANVPDEENAAGLRALLSILEGLGWQIDSTLVLPGPVHRIQASRFPQYPKPPYTVLAKSRSAGRAVFRAWVRCWEQSAEHEDH